ncbi:hypothetical protein FXW78_45325 [Rhodococcus opacus]|nr:hypothetical protein [Rhodococcus opacus]
MLDTWNRRCSNFLLATCVTERICGGLASALAQITRGQARLEEVEDRDLFLRRIDDDGVVVPVPQLFAEFLRRRLERDQPERIAELHRTASRGSPITGSSPRPSTTHWPRETRNGRSNWSSPTGMDLIEHAQMFALLVVAAKLPPRLAASSPRIQLTMAWADMQAAPLRGPHGRHWTSSMPLSVRARSQIPRRQTCGSRPPW